MNNTWQENNITNFFEICLPNAESLYAAESVKKEAVTGQVTGQVAPQVAPQVEDLLNLLQKHQELGTLEIAEKLKLKDRNHVRAAYVIPALESELVDYTIPDKPNSRLQKYKLTELGRAVVEKRNNE